MQVVKLRYRESGLQPRRTKLEIPGWGGDRQPRAEGSTEQVWHCLPFSEGAQYGIELFYPYPNELRVSTREGKLILEGDFGPAPDTTPTSCCSISTPARAGRFARSRTHAIIPTEPAPCRSRCRPWCEAGGR